MMNINLHNGVREQAGASRQRLADAQALFAASRWRGAMYLAGYAVECLLKAKLMQIYDCRTLRELESELKRRSILPAHGTVFTHQLKDLIRLAPGHPRLLNNSQMLSVFNDVNRWTPSWRYIPTQATAGEATQFMDSTKKLMHWLSTNL